MENLEEMLKAIISKRLKKKKQAIEKHVRKQIFVTEKKVEVQINHGWS